MFEHYMWLRVLGWAYLLMILTMLLIAVKDLVFYARSKAKPFLDDDCSVDPSKHMEFTIGKATKLGKVAEK